MKYDFFHDGLGQRWLRSTLLACITCMIASCVGGHRFLLPGHSPSKAEGPIPALVMQQGETRLIICEWGKPMKWGFSPGLACADETVARVEYEDGRSTSGTVSLRALKPGITRAWYINGFAPASSLEPASHDKRTAFEVHVLPLRCCAEKLLPQP